MTLVRLNDEADLRRLLGDLIERRKALGLKQSDVAARVGIGQQHVSHIERGKTQLTVATLQHYARAVEARAIVLLEEAPPVGRAETGLGSAS